jgi:hypothetical protein
VIVDNECELWLQAGNLPALLLTGETLDENGFRYRIEALSEDATWDNPVPVDTAVQRWMADGAVATTQGHENRTPYFKVAVSADTSADLAAGEQALARRANQVCTLTWIPPEGAPDAPASVFEIWTWHLEHELDDNDELELERMYGLRFTAKPWARSAGLTQVAAIAVPTTPVTTLIDACTSTTAWTGNPNPPTVVSGAVVETRTASALGAPGSFTLTLTRTAAVTISPATPYIAIDATASGGSPTSITSVTADGVPLTSNGSAGTVTWYTLPVGVTSFTKLGITSTHHLAPLTTATLTLSVADISQTNTLGGAGSTKQLFRTFSVGGSVKTAGSLQIAAADGISSLGTVAVYTAPDNGSGFVPALRRYRTTGQATTADNTAVSGVRETLVNAGTGSGAINFSIPASQVRDSNYALIGRFKTTGATTITVTITAGSISYTMPVVFPAATTYVWVPLGVLDLPVLPTPPESTQPVTLSISGTGGSGTQYLDELYLFDITNGAFSLIDVNLPRLWLDAPDVNPVTNTPAVYRGTPADRTDAISPPGTSIRSLMAHDLAPEGSILFTVTDLADGSNASVSFYRRWHTHAGS